MTGAAAGVRPHRAALGLPVVAAARALVGCTLRAGETSGIIVETEAYHESEPACHAFVGLTPRTSVLFEAPGVFYVYRSYGIHALINVVAEPAGVGAAVLIRALEPLEGLELMRERRGVRGDSELCSGPGKLTQALGIDLDVNGTPIDGPVVLGPPLPGAAPPAVVAGPRIGISRAVELPWRFCAASSPYVSRPRI